MKRTLSDSVIATLIAIAWLVLVTIALAGCTAQKDLHTSATDSTYVQVSKYDSTALRINEANTAFLRELMREYKPGRDSVVVVDGQPVILQAPPQVTREVIRETGTQAARDVQVVQVVNNDSLLVRILAEIKAKKTEREVLPPKMIIAAFIGLAVLIVAVLLVVLWKGNKLIKIIRP